MRKCALLKLFTLYDKLQTCLKCSTETQLLDCINIRGKAHAVCHSSIRAAFVTAVVSRLEGYVSVL